jgi:hypothetical protein
MADEDEESAKAEIVRFPQSRVRPAGTLFLDLGPSTLAKRFGEPREQKTGHWCSRCRGIWYGYLLEVTCPVCGSRQG